MKKHCILFLVNSHSVEVELTPNLLKHYTVTAARSRRNAIQCLDANAIDLTLIHIPSLRFDLTRFCDDTRGRWPNIPLFFLLDKGMRLDQFPHADGYLRVPFTARQLLQRLSRVLPEHLGEIVAWQNLQLDTEGYRLMWNAKQIPLTAKQATLMLAFLKTPEETLSRARLMQDVWGTDYLGDTRTLDVHIHWLRQSLQQLQAPFELKTVRGKGYYLSATQET
ncbi:MAG TPA: winged helix-turn-helix domain-containing protein [Anaerolineae bacterium]|nr:winged helix-turn-helix domain-containing protein [Anaerolineae bacterium]